MRGAASLFSGPSGLTWGPPADPEPDRSTRTSPRRWETTGLYAAEVSSGHVYALCWDHEEATITPPVWVRLP